MSSINESPISYLGVAASAVIEEASEPAAPADARGSDAAESLWTRYRWMPETRRTLERIGPSATLIEWDNDVPPLPILAGEVERAKAMVSADVRRRHNPLTA